MSAATATRAPRRSPEGATAGAAGAGSAAGAGRPNRPSRVTETQLVPTLCVTALSVVTAVSLCRVFPDWGYLRPMLVAIIGTHVVAAALRFARVPLFVALPLVMLAIIELIGYVYYRGSLGTAWLPTSDTIDLMRVDLRAVVDQFPTAVAPVPSSGNWAVATAAALATCAAMADTFAFRAFGRAETVAPTAVVFIFTAALGTERNRVVVAALWIAVALLVVAVLRFRSTAEETAWMGGRTLHVGAALPTMVLLIAVVAVMAAALAPRLPGAGSDALYDTRDRGGSVTEILSPLVDIGSTLNNQGSRELFAVESSDGGHYWRLTGLNVFNGSSWEVGDETLQQMGDRSNDGSFPGVPGRQVITIAAMGGNLVPSAYRPVRVDPDVVVWAPESQSLVLPDTDLRAGDVIAVDTEILRPSPDLLRSLGTAQIDAALLALPADIPAVVTDTAAQVVGGTTNAYDAAIALQNWFRSEFAYDDSVNFTNSTDAMVDFLQARRGFCQQFAGTFAAMARSLGLPTRVAVGFTPGERDADGIFRVYGRHAHAWPEVWFDDLGWVAFEPTPGRGNGDTTSYTGIEEQQAAGGNPGGVIETTVPASTPDTTPTTDSTPTTADPDVTTPVATAPAEGGTGTSSDGSSLPWLLLGLIALVAVWMVAAPRVVRALVHRHDDTAADRVVSAWKHTLGVLSLAGAPSVRGHTPIEYAAVAHETTGVDQRALGELAQHVTAAVYAPKAAGDTTAARCELLAHEIDHLCRDRIPTATRVQALFDPRLMRRRWTI